MYKRIFSAILALALAALLTACDIIPNIFDNEQQYSGIDGTSSLDSDINTNPQNNLSDNSSQVISTEISDAKTPTVSSPYVEIPKDPKTDHTALSRDSYYQYSNLNKTQRQIYNKIYDSISKINNIIDIEKYDLNSDEVNAIYSMVLADNPQFFWVSKFCTYTISSQGSEKTITRLNIYYTDGQKTDDIDGDRFISMADRDKISEQISSFYAKTEAFLKTVSPSASDLEKERLIHDFVLRNITYDSYSAATTPTLVNCPRAWDAYGAMVNGTAVCEGYSKLFQYLCYQVGINATYVCGTAEGASHAWNTVKQGGMWYHVDTTWDDCAEDGYPLYHWFNLTDAEIKTDHIIYTTPLNVPQATATEYSVKNTFAMTVNNLKSAPDNYKNAIDYMVKFGDKRVTLYLNVETLNSAYLNTHLLGSNSTLGKYIAQKGYKIKFSNSPLVSSDGTCIFLEKA